ncbi:MAG: hypothetical protein P8100_15575 [bacterium]
MKSIEFVCRYLSLLLIVLLSNHVNAQVPEKMTYQAVIRDADNFLVSEKQIGLQISILRGAADGEVIYIENQLPFTNTNGLISIEFGGQVGFDTISWAMGPLFIKTEVDPEGGTDYTITGTTQIVTVPYALHARNTDTWTSVGDTSFTFRKIGIGTKTPDYPLVVTSVDIPSAAGLKLLRTRNNLNYGVPLHFYMLNSNAEEFRYAQVVGGIVSNTSENERGFLSLMVANGTGTWTEMYVEEVMHVETGKVTVKDVMHLEPRSSAPSSPTKGDMYMDKVLSDIQ